MELVLNAQVNQPLAHLLPVDEAPQVAADPLTVKRPRKPRTTKPRTFTPLALETRTHLPTPDAAHNLGKSAQTLRTWACFETGPIRPVRIPGTNGLLWPVAAIKAVLGLEVQS